MARVLALGGSVRASVRNAEFLMETVRNSPDLPSYLAAMAAHFNSGKPDRLLLSNSEVLAGISLLGAKSLGAEVDFFPLLDLFQKRELSIESFSPDDYGLDEEITHRDLLHLDNEKLKLFQSKMEMADGIIFASPVYFGDRSSVANKFIQLAGLKNLIEGKVVSAVSVGTKRNGGQETTNIFFLYEALNLGAFIVGNGPESSQYGGTGWAGDKGKILKDNFGIETSYGTGVRTTQVCRIKENMPSELSGAEEPLTISVVVTMDTSDKMLYRFIESYLLQTYRAPAPVRFNIIELINGDIDRCLACNICPIPKFMTPQPGGEISYACIIRRETDSMSALREQLLASDGIILAGLNLKDMSKVIYRYQAFMERTRFIRRNDFEMTNTPISGYLFNEVGAALNPIHNLKVMTSFLRHNGIMLKPVTTHFHNGTVLETGEKEFADFVGAAGKIKSARKKAGSISVSYKALGYGDKTLDETQAVRS